MTGTCVVALTTYPPDDGGSFTLPRAYIDAVRRAGARALLVPPGEPDPEGLLDVVDAVILTGGGDVDPARYGGAAHPTIYNTDDARDRTELALVDAVLARGTPTMAICRGQQVLNVACGGTLHPHLPDVVGEEVTHRAPPREPVPHAVTVEPGSLVASVMGECEVTPMSWHHQAIDRLGSDLRAVAWAPDGTIEAVQHDHHRWLLSVQWHPELTAAGAADQQRLFDGLVAAVREIRR